MKILLISPNSAADIDTKIMKELPFMESSAFFAPHAVVSVAALTPKEHEIQIFDEALSGPVEKHVTDNNYDIIGITLISNQLERVLQIIKFCKESNISSLYIAGGVAVQNLLDMEDHGFDVIFFGETEDTWPLFLKEYKNNNHKKIYKNITKPDMELTPVPRWDLIKNDIKKYGAVSVQTTRGCPHDCSFCDVIYTNGRKPRNKTISQVLEEVKLLYSFDAQMILFADDNFTGNRKYAKELLRELIKLNNSFEIPVFFMTQLDITIAKDDELLELLADANFTNLMIGIESINKESLKEYNKLQNLTLDIKDSVNKIQSYGMIVLAHMIIGIDSDDKNTFQSTMDFIQETNIVQHFCHPLMAPPGTKLWYDLKRKGRLVKVDLLISDKLDMVSNIIPKQMTRVELFKGLSKYWDEVYKPKIFSKRAIGYLQGIKRWPKVKTGGFKQFWKIKKMLFLFVKFFMFKTTKEHRKAFIETFRFALKTNKKMIPQVFSIFICYMLDYKRSKYAAEISMKQANYEIENPDKILVEDTSTPIAENILKNSTEIFKLAYKYIIQKSGSKEVVYKVIVNAMIDYNDRFGQGFTVLDEFQENKIFESCERAFNTIENTINTQTKQLKEEPPAGFSREILDTMDNTIRINSRKKII